VREAVLARKTARAGRHDLDDDGGRSRRTDHEAGQPAWASATRWIDPAATPPRESRRPATDSAPEVDIRTLSDPRNPHPPPRGPPVLPQLPDATARDTIVAMDTELFHPNEIVKQYDDGWTETPECRRLSLTDECSAQLVRRLQEHHAGITIIGGSRPIGSGVLVRTSAAYGVLTAGHVCKLVKDEIDHNRAIRCIPQGTREPVPPGQRAGVLIRKLSLRGVSEEYDPSNATPDYGCLMVPWIDGRAMEAWGTFMNLTTHGISRQQPDYQLEYNAWLAAGYLQERSTETFAYHWCAIGGPEAVYERDGKRYLYIKSIHSNYENPKAVKGMSGSGVWEIPVSAHQHEAAVQIGTPILRGISFWQEARADDGRFAFYAHELETIADDIVSRLDEGQVGA